ncbi:hypothetical protein MUK42_07895 [Musa troglodytarum]|uniref:SOSEKI DIX-like domain-containing protein n=1 Tax=Musa troglodytarum TaxID=320322 RepID=A0A9E7EGL1_9LILI|nr:hypothetical protein MUK42_07895 [Musa troglodytarum]
MDARMRRYAPQTSPERTKVWTEPPPKHPQQQQGRKVPVVYYLCRNRHLEHPHFIEVPLSSPEGLYLRDVMDRLNVLRGRKMAAMYSWSCKRSYKNGFVWHDLSEDDLILPAQGNEFVLKGSELLDQTPPDRNNHGTSNAKVQNPKHPLQDSPPVCYKGQEASCSSSSATVVIKEAKLPLTSTMQPNPPPPAMQEDELSPSTRRSGSSGNFSPEPCGRTAPSSALGSPDPADYRICKPVGAQDASTQTDDGGGRRTCGTNTRVFGVSTDDRPPHLEYGESQNEQTMCVKEETEIVKVERSPPPTFSSIPSSCGKMNTLESLIRDEVSKRNNFRVVEEEDIFLPTGPKFKATNMLMNVITCGSISVKDHYGFGFVPTYRPRFTDMKFSSPMFSNPIVLGEINCMPESQRGMGLRMKKKEYINGSVIEPNKYKEETGEGVADLKQSSLFDDDRSFNIPFMRKDKEKAVDLIQSKCLPRSIKITSSKHSRNDQNETMMSPVSDKRNSSAGPELFKSSPIGSSNGGSKRIVDDSSVKGLSMRLTSGARVIIQSRSRCDDSEAVLEGDVCQQRLKCL